MDTQPRRLYEFGTFRLDVAERLLFRSEEPVSLTPKAFDLLAVLVQRSGRLVEKEELLREVWSDSFVEESNLSNNIHVLRKVLGGGAKDHTFIETVPRHGYRFVADVREVQANDVQANDASLVLHQRTRGRIVVEEVEQESPRPEEEPPPPEVNASLSPSLPAARRPRMLDHRAAVLFVILIVVTAAAGSYMWMSREKSRVVAAGVGRTKSIAVLPFKTLGAESNNDVHLGLGMTDATITKLSTLNQFAIRPTSAIFKYTDQSYDPLTAGIELGVEAVLSGTVQRSGDSVRVTVQLINVADGRSLWAERFDERFTGIFAVQDAISEQVAQALKLKLTSEEKKQLAKRYTDSVEAYQAYVRGIYFWNKRTEEGLRRGIEYFEQATRLDPNYALAYAGLADSYALVGVYHYTGIAPPAEAFQKAKAAAAKSLQLDDKIAEAHVALALIKADQEWDMAGAESEYKQALILNPKSATAHHRYSQFLIHRGRLDEASVESKRALELDPLAPVINGNHAMVLYFLRRYDEAAEYSRKALEVEPDNPRMFFILGRAMVQKGMYDEAAALFRRCRELEKDEPVAAVLLSLAHVYALAGRREEARRVLSEVDKLNIPEGEGLLDKALVYDALGERDRALRVLEEQAPRWTSEPMDLKFDPRYENLRSDPRCEELLKRRFGHALKLGPGSSKLHTAFA
ncbi:MAG: winged helix-turn-helix domain-containing protein [Pyrinomonadaceae bacterium]|nr:winged helix-turn-helix domain-containing protein [Pyrinomonadaceae bacterium]